MKTRISFYFLFLLIIVSSLGASEIGPVAVSPGSDVGIAVVGQNCPTFSWTSVEWAKEYKIEVFEALSAELLSHKDMATRIHPILSKEIQGRALSWTPSSDERLSNSSVYVWYVQAMDAYGTAKWSEGRMFRVELEDRLVGLVDKLTETLKANGVTDDVINKVLSDMIPETEGGNIGADGSQNSGYRTQDKLGIQGNEVGTNTWYGQYAGASLTIGYYNTFLGQYAGNNTTSGFVNTFIGQTAGITNNTGENNAFMGQAAGYSNISGSYNTFIGQNAGYNNTTANNNTFMGQGTGYTNDTGYDNTFIGHFAGYSTTSGYNNTFIGADAGNANTTGFDNTFMGQYAGYSNTTGRDNTFIGQYAGNTNTTADYNTFMGQFAGYSNSTGPQNTFMGQHAGYSNTTGSGNTFIGQATGYSHTTGFTNIFIGQAAGFHNTEGWHNTFVGASAGLSNSTGNSNTFIGWGTGHNNETGSGNVFIGWSAGKNETGSDKLNIDNSDTSSPLIYGEFDNNIVAINGKLGVGTQSPGYNLEVETTGKNALFVLDRTDGAKTVITSLNNKAAIGTLTNHPLIFAINAGWKMRLNTDDSLSMSNGATCTAGGVWQDASSRAYKENIQGLTAKEAGSALSALNPVKYNYKKDKEDEHLGFIAEDVPDLVASKDRKGMSPMDVVAVLTKVVQEQRDTITELQKRITKLERKSQ